MLILMKKNLIKYSSQGDENYQYPLGVSVELTDHCNLKCVHCYINEDSTVKYNYISSNKIINTLKMLSVKGLNNVELSGGELFSHPEINYLIDEICKIVNEVAIFTNATLINDSNINVMKKYKDKVTVQVSLHGYKEKSDEFTGIPGAFNETIQSIKLLVDNGINVKIATCIYNGNIDGLESIVKLTKDLGCKNISFSPISIIGKAKNLKLEKTDDDELQDKLLKIREKYGDYILTDFEYLLKSTNKNVDNCGVLVNNFNIASNGDVGFCPIDPGLFKIGNIFEDLNKTLKNSQQFKVNEVISPRIDICGDCEYIDFCARCIVKV